MTRLANLYSEIWTLLATSRFCLFFAVSFFIYQSKPGAWGFGHGAGSGYDAGEDAVSGLGQLKNRVVFTYAFMEAMIWFWVGSISCFSYIVYLYKLADFGRSTDSVCPPRRATGSNPSLRDAGITSIAIDLPRRIGVWTNGVTEKYIILS